MNSSFISWSIWGHYGTQSPEQWALFNIKQVLNNPLFLFLAAGRSLLDLQSCGNSSREVVSYSPGPSGFKFRSHPDHLTVGEPRFQNFQVYPCLHYLSIFIGAAHRLAWGHLRNLLETCAAEDALSSTGELATWERRRPAGAHPGVHCSKCLAATSRFSLRLPHRPSTANLYAKLGRAARLASTPSTRGPTPSRF